MHNAAIVELHVVGRRVREHEAEIKGRDLQIEMRQSRILQLRECPLEGIGDHWQAGLPDCEFGRFATRSHQSGSNVRFDRGGLTRQQ
jgi:hypothetical protein